MGPYSAVMLNVEMEYGGITLSELLRAHKALRRLVDDPHPVSLDTGRCRYCRWMFMLPSDEPIGQTVARLATLTEHPEGCPWRVAHGLKQEQEGPGR